MGGPIKKKHAVLENGRRVGSSCKRRKGFAGLPMFMRAVEPLGCMLFFAWDRCLLHLVSLRQVDLTQENHISDNWKFLPMKNTALSFVYKWLVLVDHTLSNKAAM